jgi:hypothetical protein
MLSQRKKGLLLMEFTSFIGPAAGVPHSVQNLTSGGKLAPHCLHLEDGGIKVLPVTGQ